jgi:hypothetical protein
VWSPSPLIHYLAISLPTNPGLQNIIKKIPPFRQPTLQLKAQILIVVVTITESSSAPLAKDHDHEGALTSFTPLYLEAREDLQVPPFFNTSSIFIRAPQGLDTHVKSVANWVIRPSSITTDSTKPIIPLAQI